MPARPIKTAPRPPSAEAVLDDLALMTTAGLRASIEPRAHGLHILADMLCGHIDGLHAVQRAAEVRLRGAIRTETAP
ncbi:MAG: hypothetical protein YHS30scaffold324_38 [Catenulispora phage 69_17]|jgi:hypothetical protein|nr:MAG: hypothetical protein YHS30scaffold324_38 [Catenulispora phage 69_17]